MKKIFFTLTITTTMALTSCNENELTPGLEVPSTYTFERNGESSVSFSGQTERLDMLSEIKTYIRNGDAGNEVDATVLDNMFANTNTPFTNPDLNASTKQLEDKTFLSDVAYYKDLFTSTEAASVDVAANGTMASQGTAGLIERGTSGNFILVNEKGWEFTQFVEKGLMGSVFLHQIYNVYLTESRIGPSVENETLSDGANYTAKEHHFDEAFGYWGVPVDFPVELPAANRRFWANYSYGREGLIGSVTRLKEAFLKGRTAIVNNDQAILDEQTEVIYHELELVSASTAIYYINNSIADLNSNDRGNLLHHLSEAYMFVRALKFSPFKSITDQQLNTILNTHFGTDGDFWTITLNGLQAAKTILIEAYPELADVADQL